MEKYWKHTTAFKKKELGSTEAAVRKHLVKRIWKRKAFLVHEKILPRWDRATAAISAYEASTGKPYRFHTTYSFAWRKVRGGVSMSNHAFGIAFDFNPGQNPMKLGKVKTDIPKYFRDAFKAEGFRWGGDYKVRKDAMHFEA
jgi:hypothetical protein